MNNKDLHMSLPVHYSIDETFDSDKFIKLRLDFAHDGTNPNHTRFSKEKLEDRKGSLFLSPLLGHIVQDEDGNYEFGGHDMEFRPNPFQNDKMQIYYLEQIIGIIPPESLANFEVKEVNGRNRVFVDGYLYKEYSNFAEDILKQYDKNPISMEVDILQYSYSVKEDVYDVHDFKYKGITFLNQNSGTGMIDANSQFCFEKKDAQKQMDEMITLLQDLKETFGLGADNKIFEEGGKNAMEDTINTQTVETVAENTEVVAEAESTETVEAVAGATEETSVETVAETETPSNNEVVENNFEDEAPKIEESDVKAEANESFEADNENGEVAVPEAKFCKTYELSHDDIRHGLYVLLSNVEAENNEYYFIDEVFDNYFDYCSEFGKFYRQSYTRDENDNVQFSGERVEMFAEKLTKEEKSALDMLRANYEAQTAELEELRAFKAQYDLAEKNAMVDKWADKISTYEGFNELKENIEKYSLEEIETKCKCIFAENMAFTATFAAKKDKGFNPVVVNLRDNTGTAENKPYNGFIEEYSSR